MDEEKALRKALSKEELKECIRTIKENEREIAAVRAIGPLFRQDGLFGNTSSFEIRRSVSDAWARLYGQFEPYIRKTALSMNPLHPEDSIAAGAEGLLYAARNYKEGKGARFFTYAYLCIHGYIGWDMRESRLIRIPGREVSRLKNEDPDGFANLTSPISLDRAIREPGKGCSREPSDLCLADTIASDADVELAVMDSLQEEEAERLIRRHAFKRRKEERNRNSFTHAYDGEMFCLFYGVLGRKTLTMKDIARRFGTTHHVVSARIKQILYEIQEDSAAKELVLDIAQ